MRLKLIFNKKVAAVVLSVMMAFGINVMPTKAAMVSSNVYSTSGGAGNTIYIRKHENGQVLGIMYLHMSNSAVYNEFTASSVCDSAAVSVSNSNSGYVSNTGSKLGIGDYVIARKNVSNPSYSYGYCTVSYDNKYNN